MPSPSRSPIAFGPEMTIAIHVTDMDKSIEWYTKILGFQLLYKVDEIGWCELSSNVPGAQIGLSQVEKAGASRSCVPTFAVKDIAAARKHLESCGVRFDGDTHTIEGLVKLATFFDPDGNAFMFSQSLMSR
jgi:catechol 2,3-dioxygenase-like lactoylglutathione lyase family enzyme